MKANKWYIFEIISYILVIIAGTSAIVFHFMPDDTLGWILITLGVLNLGAILLKYKKND